MPFFSLTDAASLLRWLQTGRAVDLADPRLGSGGPADLSSTLDDDVTVVTLEETGSWSVMP